MRVVSFVVVVVVCLLINNGVKIMENHNVMESLEKVKHGTQNSFLLNARG